MTVNSEFYSNLTRRKRILQARPDPIYIFVTQQGHSMRFCVDILDDTVRTEAESLIRENGGVVEDDSVPISPFTTILVQEGASPDEYDRVVFNVSYLLDCTLQRSILPLGPYAVGRTIEDTFFDVIYYRTKAYKNLRIYGVVETDSVARYDAPVENDEPIPQSPQPSKRRKIDDSDSSMSSTKFIRKKAKVSLDSTTEAESSEHKKRRFESTSEDDCRSTSTGTSKDSKIEDSLSENDRASTVKPHKLNQSKVTQDSTPDDSPTSEGTHSKESEREDEPSDVKPRKLDRKKVTQKDSTEEPSDQNRSKEHKEGSEDDSFKSSVSVHTKDDASPSRKLHPQVHRDLVKARRKKVSSEDSDSCSTVDLEAEMAKNMSQRRIRRKISARSIMRKTVDSESSSDECDKNTSNNKPEKPRYVKISSKTDDSDFWGSEPDERSKLRIKKKPLKMKRQEKSKTFLKSDETNKTITLKDSEMIKPSVLHNVEDCPVVIVSQKQNKKAESVEIVVLSSDSETDSSVILIEESDDDSVNEVLRVKKKAGSSKKGNEVLKNDRKVVKKENKMSLKSSELKNEERSEKVAKDFGRWLSKRMGEESRSTNLIVNDKKEAAKNEKTLEKGSQKSPERKNEENMPQKMEENQKCSTSKEEESCSSKSIGNDKKGAANEEVSEKVSQKSPERRKDEERSQAKDQKADKEVISNLPNDGKAAANIKENIHKTSHETQNHAKEIEEKPSKEVGEGSSSRKQEDSLEKTAQCSTSEKSGEKVDDGAQKGEKSTSSEEKAEKVNGTSWIAPLVGIVKSRPVRSVEHCVTDPELDVPSTSTVKSAPPRRPYTRREQETILLYIIRKNAHLGSLRSNVVWRKMEKANVCHGRTWQSLKNHFLKTLVHELDRYAFLSSDDKELMRGKK